MKKNILLSMLLLLLCAGCQVSSNKGITVGKQTFIYSIKESDTLRLDKYDMPSAQTDKPCVIFVFGGGFKGGERDSDFNTAYLKKLAESGYVAIGIDYRLGLKNLDASKASDLNEVAGLLQQSIYMAVEDLFDATRFIHEHAQEWKINTGMIVANGSSAGALTVLQGEYMISHQATLTQKLPEGFHYGGIIAFAGAILSDSTGLTWPSKPAPIQLFHGDADKNVPYNKVEMENIGGLYGSKYVAGQLQDMQSPYYFYEVINAAHEIAGDPMVRNLEEIKSFITKYVIKKEALTIHLWEKQIGKPDMEKEFTFMDYIQTNYM